MGFPHINDLKNIITINGVKNCPITVDDINLAKKIFGADIASLKGKLKRQKPIPVVSEIIEIPKELLQRQKHVDLCFDIMYVNGLTFLTTVSKHILYRTSFFIPTREIPDIMTGLNKVMTLYK